MFTILRSWTAVVAVLILTQPLLLAQGEPGTPAARGVGADRA